MGCSDTGIQGTSLFSSFNGVEKVQVLSPRTISLEWGLDKKFYRYNVYVNGGSSPTQWETFSTSKVKNLEPSTTYMFKVTGLSSDTAEKDVGVTLSATTWASFTGLQQGGVTLKSPTEVTLTWNMNSPLVTYKIFTKKFNGTWNLSQPTAIATLGTNTHTVTGLSPGEKYCFYVQAHYKDDSVEPETTSEAAINAVAPCEQMTSVLPNRPAVMVNSAVPGPFPWFWTSSGDPTYKTDVFEEDTNVLVASVVGNDSFHAFAKASEGAKRYYAIVGKNSEVARVPVEVSGKITKQNTKIRTLNASGTRGPIYPNLINGGHGRQNLGTNIVTGDFNCDGAPDVAVSMPSAVLVPSTNHYVETGGIVVYYSYIPNRICYDSGGEQIPCPYELKTDVKPSITATFPDPVLITYPATSDYMRLGKIMATGNFNGDCYQRTDGPTLGGGNCNTLFTAESNISRLKGIKSCDDLVISADNKSFYVIYGDPTQGLVTGSGASTAGENEFTCDTFSNSCRVVRMTAPTTPLVYGSSTGTFVEALTTGDFNNDGFDELAVTTPIQSMSGYRNVLIYRGGAQGLHPFNHANNHASIDITNPAVAAGLTSLGALTNSDEFGYSLGTAYDSRRCVNGTPAAAVYRPTSPAVRKGYDFTKCDDLVIGAPGRSSQRGSIFSCKGQQSHVTDKQKITSWNCQEHFPSSLAAQVARYGQSVVGARNFNGYPVLNIKSNPTNISLEVPDVTGAVFVGAPYETVTVGATSYTRAGAVYGYYITPLATDYSSGGLQGILGSSSLGHAVEAVNDVACDRLNANKTTGSLRHCLNQKLMMSPTEAGVRFGEKLGVLPLLASPDRDEESMKMLAIAAPYRSVSRVGGSGVVSSAGSVFLYRADVSTFGAEGVTPILSPQKSAGTELNYSCLTNCTWYSGGVSPYGSSVFYPSNLTTEAYFGLGGIIGGSFNGDTEGDLIATAPSLSYPTPENGGVFVFNSRSGFAPTENVPSQSFYTSLGLEGGYHFEEAKVIGDINNDGYDDVATHINANGTWSLVIFYGSPNGLIKAPAPSALATAPQPQLISLASDRSFGEQFFPAGDVNGDGYKDILVIGALGSYLYYGSLSGIEILQEPVIAPIGKGPLLFARPGNQNNLEFSGTWNSTSRPVHAAYNSSLQAVTTGDFNKDGIDDMAIRYYSNNDPGSDTMGGLNYAANQYGRVVIIYGSLQGPQVNRNSGRITLKNAGGLVDVAIEDPCTTTRPAVCKVQFLGLPNTTASSGFGFGMAVVRSDNSPFSALYDRLLIGDYSMAGADGNNDGAVHVFEGSLTGIKTSVVQTLVPRPGKASQKFGWQIASVGDLNGDSYADIVISAGTTSAPEVYTFYGQVIGGVVGFYGASSLTTTDFWTTPIANNQEHTSTATPVPQVIRPIMVLNNELLGWGIVGVGDFNNDGYNDVALNVPNGDSTLSGTLQDTGFVVILFGSSRGLQIRNPVLSPYPRCHGGASPVCDPMQVFLPDGVEYENTSINPYSVGDINGDGYRDLVVGGVGRDLQLPSGLSATSTGVIYILY